MKLKELTYNKIAKRYGDFSYTEMAEIAGLSRRQFMRLIAGDAKTCNVYAMQKLLSALGGPKIDMVGLIHKLLNQCSFGLRQVVRLSGVSYYTIRDLRDGISVPHLRADTAQRIYDALMELKQSRAK